MKRIPVNSSNIKSVGFDHDEKILEIEYHGDKESGAGGGVYRYWDVPLATYENLLTADSPGNYVAKEVKPNFVTKKVDVEDKAVMPRFRGAVVDVETK